MEEAPNKANMDAASIYWALLGPRESIQPVFLGGVWLLNEDYSAGHGIIIIP